jgi:hypothetical protein
MGRVYGFSLPPLLFVDGVYVFACGSKFDWGDYRDIRKRWGWSEVLICGRIKIRLRYGVGDALRI